MAHQFRPGDARVGRDADQDVDRPAGIPRRGRDLPCRRDMTREAVGTGHAPAGRRFADPLDDERAVGSEDACGDRRIGDRGRDGGAGRGVALGRACRRRETDHHAKDHRRKTPHSPLQMPGATVAGPSVAGLNESQGSRRRRLRNCRGHIDRERPNEQFPHGPQNRLAGGRSVAAGVRGDGAGRARRSRGQPRGQVHLQRRQPRRSRSRDPRPQARRSGDQRGGVQRGREHLFPALRRLPRRAAQGRDRQAADARHHPRTRLRLSQGLHHIRLARGHAELGHLGRPDRGAGRSDGALRADRSAAAAGIRHGQDARELEPDRCAGEPADRADERPEARQPFLGDAARCGPGGADRRRHLRDPQDPRDRLRGPHQPHLGLRTLSLRDRPRRGAEHDRSLDGGAHHRRDHQDRLRGALRRDLEVRRLRGQVRDRRRLLAAAIRDHGRRHAGAS